MSIRRLNYLIQNDILPFNYGMNYDDWVQLYSTPNHRYLVVSNPTTWTPEEITEINKKAQEENELCERLMKLSDEEFYAEVKRLTNK